jgi:hypothetical protein
VRNGTVGQWKGAIVSGPTPDEIKEIRLKALEVEFRAKSDTRFFKQLQDNPEQVLRDAGFDDPTVADFAGQLRGDVPHPCGDFCDGITCIVTTCCFLTLDKLPPVEDETI